MPYTGPILVTGDMIARVSSVQQVSNPGQPGFGMNLNGVTALGDSTTTFRLVWFQNVNPATNEFLNGQGWTLERYVGNGNPVTDTNPLSWQSVSGLGNLGPRNDIVSGTGAGDEYVIFDAGGTSLLYDFNGGLSTTSTNLFYSGTDTAQNGDPLQGDNDSQLDFLDGYAAYCFCEGTLIETDHGEVAVEDLVINDLVLTLDHGFQPVRWIGTRCLGLADTVSYPELLPVCLTAGSLGSQLPARNLRLSPQHRIMLRSKITERMTGCREALVAVKHLCEVPGVAQELAPRRVTYVHIRLDQHDLVKAEQLWAETLLLGAEALKAMGPEARRELRLLFPELLTEDQTDAVRQILPGRIGRNLAARHVSNRKHLTAN